MSDGPPFEHRLDWVECWSCGEWFTVRPFSAAQTGPCCSNHLMEAGSESRTLHLMERDAHFFGSPYAAAVDEWPPPRHEVASWVCPSSPALASPGATCDPAAIDAAFRDYRDLNY